MMATVNCFGYLLLILDGTLGDGELFWVSSSESRQLKNRTLRDAAETGGIGVGSGGCMPSQSQPDILVGSTCGRVLIVMGGVLSGNQGDFGS
ncbi:hypothetical protein L1049_001278 [Liquidambar formosana]|uniref:Secreted protein n=1 Tax=Liquidambar formosana TaxID=63359 RepID=A0AAP0R607_LIQFO